MDNKNLEKRIVELEKQMQLLTNASTIPWSVDTAFTGRGFLKLNNFIITGQGTIGIGGTYTIVLQQGVTDKNTVLATYISNVGGVLSAIIRESPSFTNQYELYVEGIATEVFQYVVFLGTDNTILS